MNRNESPGGTGASLTETQTKGLVSDFSVSCGSSVPARDHNRASYLVAFRRRVLTDALLEATAAYWERRARDFDNAISRDGDYPGRRSIVRRLEADMRNRARATACRNHAAFIRANPSLFYDDLAADVDAVLGEAA